VGIIEPLVERGLIERRPHPYDGRQRVLALTAAGRRAYTQMEAASSTVRMALERLDAGGLDEAEAGLRVLVKQFQRERLVVVAAPCAGCVYFRPGAGIDAERPHRCALI